MQVQFNHEKMEQIDTIKNAIKRDFKKLGFDHMPESITDHMALEYALSFTSEVLAIKLQQHESDSASGL